MTHLKSTRRLHLQPLEARDVPAVYDLGAAADFNLFAFGDVEAFTSDVEGRVAVGGNASFYAYGLGDKLTDSNGTRDDLIVGNDLNFKYGQVFNGNIVYGNQGTLESVGIPNGTARQQANVLDFAAAEAELSNTSAVLGAEAPNGRTRLYYGNLFMRGTHPELNIFTVTPGDLASVRSINVMVPFGSTALINVPGDAATIENLGLRLRGVGCSRILWNFSEADQLRISGVGLKGSILAPTAALDFNNGNIEGTVVIESMRGNGQFNLCPSQVSIVIPEYATLQGTVFLDMDADNLRGDPAIEVGYDGAEVFLTGFDTLGRNINRSLLSINEGQFNFGVLWPGTYAVRVVPPQKYSDSQQNGLPGTVDGVPEGVGSVNKVSAIDLLEGQDGIDYLLPLVENPN